MKSCTHLCTLLEYCVRICVHIWCTHLSTHLCTHLSEFFNCLSNTAWVIFRSQMGPKKTNIVNFSRAFGAQCQVFLYFHLSIIFSPYVGPKNPQGFSAPKF